MSEVQREPSQTEFESALHLRIFKHPGAELHEVGTWAYEYRSQEFSIALKSKDDVIAGRDQQIGMLLGHLAEAHGYVESQDRELASLKRQNEEWVRLANDAEFIISRTEAAGGTTHGLFKKRVEALREKEQG